MRHTPGGVAFDADVRFIAPGLRAVATAVELGMGASLLLDWAGHRLLAAGAITEMYDVSHLITGEPIYCSTRRVDAAHLDLQPPFHSLRST